MDGAPLGEPPSRDHLPARCCCHVLTLACPVDCLEVVLSTATFHALVRAEFAPLDPPATVGQVIELLRTGRLGRVFGLGPRRLGEIQAGLVLAGLDLGGDTPPAKGRPHVSASEGSAMGADQHPALRTDHDAPPVLTLILPPGLGKDQILAGLAEAIGQVRTAVAARAQLYQRRMEACAAGGDELGQTLCRGQVLGGEHAAAALDEAIIGVFDLWDQYQAPASAAAAAVAGQAPEASRRAEGSPQ